jgi:hypothetical protein
VSSSRCSSTTCDRPTSSNTNSGVGEQRVVGERAGQDESPAPREAGHDAQRKVEEHPLHPSHGGLGPRSRSAAISPTVCPFPARSSAPRGAPALSANVLAAAPTRSQIAPRAGLRAVERGGRHNGRSVMQADRQVQRVPLVPEAGGRERRRAEEAFCCLGKAVAFRREP